MSGRQPHQPSRYPKTADRTPLTGGPLDAHVRAGLELLGGDPDPDLAARTTELLALLVGHGVDIAVAEAAGERSAA